MKVQELHFSDSKVIDQSPAHFKARIEAPMEPTPAMVFGTLVHSLVLGGDVCVYDGERRGKAWDAFEVANEGRFIVTAKEHAKARAVAEAVRQDPVAAPLLEGQHELSWKRDLYGRPWGGRVDVYSRGKHLVDLKTTRSSQPMRFCREALRMAYHAQMSVYRDAMDHHGPVYLIAVETTRPYAVTVLELTERALGEGAKLVRLWSERLAACEAVDEWPGYVQSAWPLDIVEDAGLVIDGEDGDGEELAA